MSLQYTIITSCFAIANPLSPFVFLFVSLTTLTRNQSSLGTWYFLSLSFVLAFNLFLSVLLLFIFIECLLYWDVCFLIWELRSLFKFSNWSSYCCLSTLFQFSPHTSQASLCSMLGFSHFLLWTDRKDLWNLEVFSPKLVQTNMGYSSPISWVTLFHYY